MSAPYARCQVCATPILPDEITCDECADELMADDDGQPDEAQEWRDYDLEC